VLPPQVLIEATIAEVRLNAALRHGVRWFFRSGNHGFGLTDGTGKPAVEPGLSYVFGTPNAQVALNALQTMTNVEIVSSPALTVLDNQTARLQVGDQVPIATRSARSVISPDAPIVNDIEFKDTGVILAVTPRVNASGLVILHIAQEVSDVVPTTTSNLNSPTIRQRRINSSVAVHSGTEIVLGGLIGATRNKAGQGVPFLMDIPILGEAFKSDSNREFVRTELLVILRPTVMGTRIDVENVTREIKARMSGAAGAIYR
jgi:general secretion pathway protein D